MKQQYFCIRKSNQFLRAITGRVVGLFALSAYVDHSRSNEASSSLYPHQRRVSVVLEPHDAYMLDALRTTHGAGITEVMKHSLRLAFYMQYGYTPGECPLEIELKDLGLASLEEMEFGFGSDDDDNVLLTPRMRALLFGSLDQHPGTRVRIYTRPEPGEDAPRLAEDLPLADQEGDDLPAQPAFPELPSVEKEPKPTYVEALRGVKDITATLEAPLLEVEPAI